MTWMAAADTMFLGVDLTYSFLPPDGELKVEGGLETVARANELSPHFLNRGWTKEEHDKGHEFFASSHPGKKPLDTVDTPFGRQYLWPDHCVVGTRGAEFHADLNVAPEDLVVIKGRDPSIHAYSAVYMDDRKTIIRYEDGKTLPEKLREKGIKKVVLGGLAYDFCVGMTAYDLAREGFEVIVVRDATRSIKIPVADGLTTDDTMDVMLQDAGVKVVQSKDLPQALGIAASGAAPPLSAPRNLYF